MLIGEQYYLAGYKPVITEHADKDKYAVTIYRANKGENDNDISGDSLTTSNEYAIIAKEAAEPENTWYIREYDGTNYDLVTAKPQGGYDGGYKKYETASVTGQIFEDLNYDGVISEGEPGISEVELKLEQYYWNGEKWTKTDFTVTVTSAENGSYSFDGLDGYVLADGKYYLAGYKPMITKHADKDKYAVTLYRANGGENDSDISGDDLTESSEYVIIAKETAEPENTLYIREYAGTKYDVVTAKSQSGYDGGYKKYETAFITGQMFDDTNYDGVISEDEGFSDELAQTLKLKPVTITAEAYWFDGEIWQRYIVDGRQVTYSAQVSDKDGGYSIEVPVSFRVDGTTYLAGYKLTEDRLPGGYHITKHLINNGKSKDNTLVKGDSALYEVTKTHPQSGYLAGKDEEKDSMVIAAPVADNSTAKINVNISYGYDMAGTRTLTDYNLGFIGKQTSTVSGTAFIDVDLSGRYEEDNDVLFAGVTVGIKRYRYIDGEWELCNSDDGTAAEYYRTVTTDENGYYVFDKLPTHSEDGAAQDIPHLYGYEVYLAKMPTGPNGEKLAPAKYQIGGEGESALTVDGLRVVKAETDIPEIMDGYLITARHLSEDESHELFSDIVEQYDVADGRDRTDYDLGFTVYETASITGTAFDDTDYDGLIGENDIMLSGITVGLERFRYDNVTEEWLPDMNGNEYLATVVTDDEGGYSFDKLLGHIEENGVQYLYGYKLSVISGAEEYAVTKYQLGSGYGDSALTVDGRLIKADNTLEELQDGYILLAPKAADSADGYYTAYGRDITAAQDRTEYNAGYTAYTTGNIKGNIFEDKDYDGLITEYDRGLSDIKVQLIRYYYDEELESWIEDNGENGYYAEMLTRPNGNYSFDNLPVFKLENGKRYLYGYKLILPEPPADRAATKYQTGGGISDSSLLPDMQILKADDTLPEMKDGYIVLGINMAGRSDLNEEYTVYGYDVLKGSTLIQYNGGFAPFTGYGITGTVWNDIDRDGMINDDMPISDIEVTLQLMAFIDGEWLPIAEKTALTDSDGRYLFDGLALYGTNGKGESVLYGYRLAVEKLPTGMAVTAYQANSGDNDNDLNEATGYLTQDGEIIILADKADESTQPEYIIDGRNIAVGHSVSGIDAGLTPYGSGNICGIMFEDANNNGIFDEGEKVLPGKTVSLEYRTYEQTEEQPVPGDSGLPTVGDSRLPTIGDSSFNMIGASSDTAVAAGIAGYDALVPPKADGCTIEENGSYESYNGMTTVTDEEGRFYFNGLPILDENNNPYLYRLNTGEPDNMLFTKVHCFDKDSTQRYNLLGERYADGAACKVGITDDISVAAERDQTNKYGDKWEVDGKEHSNIYLGLAPVPPPETTPPESEPTPPATIPPETSVTPEDPSDNPDTGVNVNGTAALIMMMACMGYVFDRLIKNKKK